MIFLILAWRNLWRNPMRSLISMTAVWFAVLLSVFVQSLQTGIFDHLIHNIVGYYTGYLQLHAKGYADEQTLDRVMTLSPAQLQAIRKQTTVKEATERVEVFMLASGKEKTRGGLVNGIDPEREKIVIQLQHRLTSGHYLKTGEQAVLLGGELAAQLQLQVADTIILLGQGYQGITAAGKFLVKGLLHFGSPELNKLMVFMPIDVCRSLLGMEKQATTLVIALPDSRSLPQVRRELLQKLGPDYEALGWEDIMPEIVEHMRTDKRSGVIMSIVLYMLVSFGIFSTVLMMMSERMRELGMLMAIGMRKRQIMGMLTMESLFVTLVGCIAGFVVSFPLTWYFSRYPIRFSAEFAKIYEQYGFEAVIPTSTDPFIFLRQALVVLCISLLLSLYPMMRVYSLQPVQALKK
jgi:putative ABC transport system permease protein